VGNGYGACSNLASSGEPPASHDHFNHRLGQSHNGVGTNFGVGVGEARPEGQRAGDGVLVEGQPAPPHQLGGLRERYKLPLQRGPGRSPGRRRVFLYSVASDCFSQHLSTCCIQFTWLGIRFF